MIPRLSPTFRVALLLLLAPGSPLRAQSPVPRSPCDCRACAGATALLDDPLSNGTTVQDIRVETLASNRVRVVQHIGATPLTSDALLRRWNWDGVPGLSKVERSVFETHSRSNGPPLQVRSGLLASFFETQWTRQAPRTPAEQEAAAMHPRITRFLFPEAEASRPPVRLEATIGFLDPAKTLLHFHFDAVYALPEGHDFAVVETRLNSRGSNSTILLGIDDEAARTHLLRSLAGKHSDRPDSVRRLGVPLRSPPPTAPDER